MKKSALAVALLVVVGFVPQASAQTGSLGSLGSTGNLSPSPDGPNDGENPSYEIEIPYSVTASSYLFSAGEYPRCEIYLSLKPGAGHGFKYGDGLFKYVDRETGREEEYRGIPEVVTSVPLIRYSVPGWSLNDDWAGTTRTLDIVEISRRNGEEFFFGTIEVTLPAFCPVPANRDFELYSGHIRR